MSVCPPFQELLEPFSYVSVGPSKEIRTQLIAAFNEWLKVPVDQLSVITRVVAMLHNASLLYVFVLSVPPCVAR